VLTVAITLMVLAVVLTSVLATLLYRNISNGLSHIENTIEQVSRQQDFRLRQGGQPG
jgi:methyl-accepting chemotaxis protein